jgi:hypothetical protein
MTTQDELPLAGPGLAFGTTFRAAAVTAAYASLSGWGGPREEILERFE